MERARKHLPATKRRTILLTMDYFDAATYRGVVDWVREHDWALDASSVRTQERPRLARADGILTTVGRSGTVPWLRQFGCPIVRLHHAPSANLAAQFAGLPGVECDFESIGRLGAEHLLTLGRPLFAFYLRGVGADVRAMRDGFVATLRAAGHEPAILDFPADHPAGNALRLTTLERRMDWLKGKLRQLPTPLAIMTEDDRFAPDVVEAARALGLRVPTDVAVLGCDDNRLALDVSAIPISSVDSNLRGVGYAAADLLARLVAGEPPPGEPVRVAARRVVARQSTATYAGKHPGINNALRQLRQHFRSPLNLDALARTARLSVRGLQAGFRRELGRTIQAEWTRLRVAAAAELLEETDLKLDAVAADTNLGDAKNLCRVFAKAYGLSPDAWRRRARSMA